MRIPPVLAHNCHRKLPRLASIRGSDSNRLKRHRPLPRRWSGIVDRSFRLAPGSNANSPPKPPNPMRKPIETTYRQIPKAVKTLPTARICSYDKKLRTLTLPDCVAVTTTKAYRLTQHRRPRSKVPSPPNAPPCATPRVPSIAAGSTRSRRPTVARPEPTNVEAARSGTKDARSPTAAGSPAWS